MGFISNLLIVGFLMLCLCKNQAQPNQSIKEPNNQIFGQWKYVHHLWHPLGRLSTEQLEILKQGVLKVNKERVYFEGADFLDTCSVSSIKINKLFDKENEWEYSWYEDGEQFLLRPKDVGPLIYRYTKEELSRMDKITLTNEYCHFSYFYFTQDTLIMDLEGLTLFMTKVPFETKSFAGAGNATKELELTGKETELKLSYEFYKEADQLTVEDQNGNQLFSTGMETTEEVKKTEVPLSNVTKLVFKVKADKPSSKWKFTAELY